MPQIHALPAEELHMFVTQPPRMPLTFNQFLLMTESRLLVHTGAAGLAGELAADLRPMLGETPLRYIFVSHFESDECGGIRSLLDWFPDATTICSAVTARQLAGFGITDRTLVMAAGDRLSLGDGELSFIDYPSEMHLWPGLLAFEARRGVLFSSDLVMRFGPVEEPAVPAVWADEVDALDAERIPDPGGLCAVKEALLALPVRLVAPGHGPALEVAGPTPGG